MNNQLPTVICLLTSDLCLRIFTTVENALQISPFYAKQTQFPKKSNERKYLFNKGLQKFYPAGGAKKQTQFKPNQTQLPKG